MSNRLAQFISHLIHPLLMPSYALLIFFNIESYISYSLTFKQLSLITGLNFINTALMPILFLILLHRMNRISNFHLKDQYERVLPFMLAIIFYFFNYYLFKSSALPQIMVSMVLAGALSVSFSFLFNFWIKISIHSLAISSVAGIFFALSSTMNKNLNFTLMALVLLVGLVGTARLKLEAHEPHQVYMGSVIGFLIGFACVFFKLA